VRGKTHVGRFHAVIREPGKRPVRSKAFRHFCLKCGSPLWLWIRAGLSWCTRTRAPSTRRRSPRHRGSARLRGPGSTCHAARDTARPPHGRPSPEGMARAAWPAG
jgi:hypothetical protein